MQSGDGNMAILHRSQIRFVTQNRCNGGKMYAKEQDLEPFPSGFFDSRQSALTPLLLDVLVLAAVRSQFSVRDLSQTRSSSR